MTEDGAYFKGSIEIDRKVAAASEHPGRASRDDALLLTTGPDDARARSLTGGMPTLHLPSDGK